MVLQQLETVRITVTEFLQTVLIDNGIIYIDLWSGVHILGGLLIMYVLIEAEFKRPYLLLFVFLLGFEILEFALIISAPAFINPEPLRDFISDIAFGMLGGFIYVKINDKIKRGSK